MYSNPLVRATSFAHGKIELDRDTVETIITDEMTRQRVCCRCHKNYVEWRNIGAWLCSEHTREWDDSRHVYPCCETASTLGCQACDHAENLVVPYPGSKTEHRVLRGVPAFELCAGNLKELHGVHREARQYPPDFEDQKRAVGAELARIFIYRRCLFGKPGDDTA